MNCLTQMFALAALLLVGASALETAAAGGEAAVVPGVKYPDPKYSAVPLPPLKNGLAGEEAKTDGIMWQKPCDAFSKYKPVSRDQKLPSIAGMRGERLRMCGGWGR